MRVLLADDHSLFRAAIRRLVDSIPDCEVVAECGDGAQALPKLRQLRPDVLVLDLDMPVMDGFAVLEQLSRESVDTGVLVLSLEACPASVERAFQLGASGFMLKQQVGVQIEVALRCIGRGDRFVGHGVPALGLV